MTVKKQSFHESLTFPYTINLVHLLASLRTNVLFQCILKSIHSFLQNTQYPTYVNRFTVNQSQFQNNHTSKNLKVKVQKPLLTYLWRSFILLPHFFSFLCLPGYQSDREFLQMGTILLHISTVGSQLSWI